jgi:hypothetical protein
MNKSFRRARSSGLAHSKKSLVGFIKDQQLRLVVMELTGTWIRELSCLSGADEEEDGLACDDAESTNIPLSAKRAKSDDDESIGAVSTRTSCGLNCVDKNLLRLEARKTKDDLDTNERI